MTRITFDASRSSLLDLATLRSGMPGITPVVGAYLAEAATVCFESEHHSPGVALQVDGDCDHCMNVTWTQDGSPEQRRRSWADDQHATEQGAYGVAALLVQELTDYTVYAQAFKGTGFDYWLSPKGSMGTLLQDAARLEASGIRQGGERKVNARVRRKLDQMSPTDGTLPGVAIVVEFGTPTARVKVK